MIVLMSQIDIDIPKVRPQLMSEFDSSLNALQNILSTVGFKQFKTNLNK